MPQLEERVARETELEAWKEERAAWEQEKREFEARRAAILSEKLPFLKDVKLPTLPSLSDDAVEPLGLSER